MNLDLELNDAIFNALETNSIERGIEVQELIRWVIGDYVRFSQGPTPIRVGLPLHPLPNPATSETDKIMKLSEMLMKLSEMFMKSMINQGGIKCPNCTMPLTVEDIEAGKCSKCDAEI